MFGDPQTRLLKKGHEAAILISNLAKTIDVSHLHDIFLPYGEVITCKMPLTDGENLGYGIVHFAEFDAAQRAKQDLVGAIINGQKINIEYYFKNVKENPIETFTIVYIQNLPPQFVSDKKLFELCEPFGEIYRSALSTDFKDRIIIHNSAGFCHFKRHEDAVACVERLNGRVLVEGSKPIFVGRAKTKKEHQMEAFRQEAKSKPVLPKVKESTKAERAAKPLSHLIQMLSQDTDPVLVIKALQGLSEKQIEGLVLQPKIFHRWRAILETEDSRVSQDHC
jgi:polyadenylate-binding protein